MLFEPAPTAYDLRFRLLGVNVRVHPFFWLLSALLGWSWFSYGGLGYLLLWVGCVFVSILLHEMGHVLVGRWFGSYGYIVLFSFGGLAVGSKDLYPRWQRIAVSFAGPAFQLILWVLIWQATPHLLRAASPEWRSGVAALLLMLYVINLFWPLLNLLPIWPLDGGQIAREVCVGLSPSRGLSISLGISGVLAGLLAVHCLMASQGRPLIPQLSWLGGLYTTIFFALFAIGSFQALNEVNRRGGWDDHLPWER